MLIAGVVDNSPAHTSGLERGDIIQKIDGKDMAGSKEVQDYVRAHSVQQTLNMLVLRHNALKAVPVVVGQYPDRPINGHGDDDEE